MLRDDSFARPDLSRDQDTLGHFSGAFNGETKKMVQKVDLKLSVGETGRHVVKVQFAFVFKNAWITMLGRTIHKLIHIVHIQSGDLWFLSIQKENKV